MSRRKQGVTRRTVIKAGALGGAAFAMRGVLSKAKAEPGVARSVGVLEEDERRTLSAAVETVLPGAVEVGVVDYIEYWLAKEPFAGARRYMKVGAIQLDSQARRKAKVKSFADLDDEGREAVLRLFQEGKVRVKRFDGKVFYKQLVEFVLEGFLSDPKYGGNRNRQGWKFIGLPDGYRSCWWNPHGVRRLLSPDKGFHD